MAVKTTTHRSPASESLVEFTTNSAGTPLRVDREKGVIYGVKIIGNVSKNGREYPQSTLARAKSMYEGKAVNIDHAAKPGEPRGVRDRFGNIRSVTERADGLYGDLHFNPKHALAEQVAWDAENNPSNIGLSHNSAGRVVSRNGKAIVEEITSVASVDLVADPATTRGLFEGIDKGNHDMELAEALEKVAGLTAEVSTLKESVTKLTTENAALTAKAASLQESVDAATKEKAAAEHKAKVGELLNEHKIPEKARTKEFVALLESAPLDSATATIKSLAETLKTAGGSTVRAASGTPISESQKGGGDARQVTDGKSFAAAVRG
jgi:regulator of replication initiation timing